MSTTERDWVAEIGKPCAECLAEMVAALQCDYERLEELREQRDDYDPNAGHPDDENYDPEGEPQPSEPTWAERFKEDAEELAELEKAAGECKDRKEAAQRIQEYPLSVEVRSGWVSPGEDKLTPEDFAILLSTGGPATRIRGELDEHGEPYRAWLEVQDWGKPWTQYFQADQETLLTYAQCFVYTC